MIEQRQLHNSSVPVAKEQPLLPDVIHGNKMLDKSRDKNQYDNLFLSKEQKRYHGNNGLFG